MDEWVGVFGLFVKIFVGIDSLGVFFVSRGCILFSFDGVKRWVGKFRFEFCVRLSGVFFRYLEGCYLFLKFRFYSELFLFRVFI